MSKTFYENLNLEDYYEITLTDDKDIFGAEDKLGNIYKNKMKIRYENKRTSADQQITVNDDFEKFTPIQIMEQFYKLINNDDMSAKQKEICANVFEEIMKEEE